MYNNTTIARYQVSTVLQKNLLKRMAKIIETEMKESALEAENATLTELSLLVDDLEGENETITANLDRMKTTNDGFSQAERCSSQIAMHNAFRRLTSRSFTTSWPSKKDELLSN